MTTMSAAIELRPVTKDRLIAQQTNDHRTRYFISTLRPEPQLFIVHETIKALCRCTYEVWESAEDRNRGMAQYVGGGKTMKQALDIANVRLGRTYR